MSTSRNGYFCFFLKMVVLSLGNTPTFIHEYFHLYGWLVNFLAHYMWSHQQLFRHLFIFLLLAHFLHFCTLFTLTSFSFFFASFSNYFFLMHSSSPSTISMHYFVLHSNVLLHLRHCVLSHCSLALPLFHVHYVLIFVYNCKN